MPLEQGRRMLVAFDPMGPTQGLPLVTAADLRLGGILPGRVIRSRAERGVKPAVEETMKTRYTVALSILAGVAVGAAAVQALHAQAKPPAYVVAEIDVTNAEPYDKEYVPPAAKAITDAGGKYVVRGGRTVAIFGQPPQPRIAVMVFESMEKANAAFESSAYKEAKKIGDKYAKFRVYAVEGLLQ
jgi:uncharacterized protein (DUF1330 family)